MADDSGRIDTGPGKEPAPAGSENPSVPPNGRELPRGAVIGLIAGYGNFPVLFARKARENGVSVIAFAIRYEAGEELSRYVDKLHWIGIAKVGRLIRLMKKEGIHNAVMAGKVRKTWMYTPLRILRLLPDFRTLRLWFRRVRDRKDDTLLGAVADELASEGITLESSLLYCKDLLAGEGILAGRRPTAREMEDVAFGWTLARAMGRLDVGQSVAVKEKAVLAVEAIEGTDQAILRAGALGRSGFTVVKVSKPRQDVRFDVPAIGVDTVRTMKKAGGKVLAVEAGATLILGVEETLELADVEGITIIGIKDPGAEEKGVLPRSMEGGAGKKPVEDRSEESGVQNVNECRHCGTPMIRTGSASPSCSNPDCPTNKKTKPICSHCRMVMVQVDPCDTASDFKCPGCGTIMKA